MPTKELRRYTWGGDGRQKRAERSGFALIFLVLFASKQKEQCMEPIVIAKQSKFEQRWIRRKK
jgi:hypothetical protein